MQEEKKESKCCGCCEGKTKEINNEELDKVTGGTGWVDGQYICHHYKKGDLTCLKNKTVNGVAHVCTCKDLLKIKCCITYGNDCTCNLWDKRHLCCSLEDE